MEQNTNTPISAPTLLVSPVKKHPSFKKPAFIFLFIFCQIILLPAALIFWLMYKYSADPIIDVQAETRIIENRLYERYGKKFIVSNVTSKGRSYLGDTRSVGAKAQPKDNPDIIVSVGKNLDRDLLYTDNYLQIMWSQQDKEVSKSELKHIFSYIPEFSSQITLDPQFNTDYHEGRVIPIDEVVDKYNNKVSYSMKIVAGDSETVSDHSEKAFQVIQYMRSRFVNNQSLDYEFTTNSAKYTCYLYDFKYKFIDSAKQLEGCWRNESLALSAPKTEYQFPDKVTIIDNESLPIVLRLNKGEKAEKAASGTGHYIVHKNDGLVIDITIYSTGFGDKVNVEKKQFNDLWVDQNLPITESATINRIHPSSVSVSMGDMIYRSDTTVEKRTVNYVLFYKTFIVHISAATASPGIDLRDKEFLLESFVNSIEAVRGFSETN